MPLPVRPSLPLLVSALLLLSFAAAGSGACGGADDNAVAIPADVPSWALDIRDRTWDPRDTGDRTRDAGDGEAAPDVAVRDVPAAGEDAGDATAPDVAVVDVPPPADLGPVDVVDTWVAPPPVDAQDYERTTYAYGPGTDNPFLPDEDNSSVVDLDDEGNLVLSQSHETNRFIWIANSGEGTVSRLDTETGDEVGRYRVCSDPSRTSVDLDGNVWVGCRGDGRVVKILHDEDDCVDANGDGQIQTSRDLDGDGTVPPSAPEMLAEGTDECVAIVTAPYGSGALARAVAVDEENYAWVGFWNAHKIARFHPETGAVVQEMDVPGSTYGFAFDRRGILWVSFRSWSGGGGSRALGRIDPDQGTVQGLQPDGCFSPYGIAVDRHGRVWLGNFDCQDLVYWDQNADPPRWGRVSTGSGSTRGVAASMDGFVCTAHSNGSCSSPSGNNQVSCVDDEDFSVDTIDLGAGGIARGPVGVAFAADGLLWAVNQCASSATRVDVLTRTVLGEYAVGGRPYTYSDMTGYSLRTQIDPEGWYDVEAVARDPKFVGWFRLYADATLPEGSALHVQLRSYRTPDEADLTPWSPRFGPFPPESFPLDLSSPEVRPFARWGILGVRVILTRAGAVASPVLHRIRVEYH